MRRHASASRLARTAFFACVLSFFSAISLRAEPLTLTDNQGRVITAEPLSLEGDQLKIRRADGREFSLDIATLAEADQAKVREWAAAQPLPEAKPEPPKYVPDMKKVSLLMSRYKGETITLWKSSSYSHKHLRVGYSFSVSNRNSRPIDKVRVEYNLYVRTYGGESLPSVVSGALDYPAIDFNKTTSLKSKTAEVCQYKGMGFEDNGGELKGVWVKLLVDGEVIQEILPSESIRNDLQWVAPASP